MTYRFKSPAAGDVLMLRPDGDAALRLMGREPAARGIIEVDALHAAIAALETAVAEDERRRTRPAVREAATTEGVETPEGDEAVSLRQRTWPLLKLLKAAQAADSEVVWGV